MKRKDFFKRLGFMAGAAVVTPHILLKEEEWKSYWQEQIDKHPEEEWSVTSELFSTEMGEELEIEVKLPDGYTPEDVLRIYKETGMILFKP